MNKFTRILALANPPHRDEDDERDDGGESVGAAASQSPELICSTLMRASITNTHLATEPRLETSIPIRGTELLLTRARISAGG
ncbi:hypothetical protein DVH24_024217 [Malus domestica]|uniref:Uncharacterized protein n=1 Tax=Malus domestica TaxID=3750 RepID=A0A498JL62_MALDO|nr:hypothetical protein DVH24_024217 [Malus domestica]